VVTEPRVSLGELLNAGRGVLTRYTGTLLAVFVLQLTVAGAATFAIARVFAAAFSTLPYFDQAVDGDLTAWVYLLRNHREVIAAAGWIGGGAVLMWLAVSWFVAAGMIGVFAERPEGRAETARCFGARGASSFLPLVRLWVLSAPTYFIVAMALGIGIDAVSSQLEVALSAGRLAMWLAVALAPGLLLLHLLWTISEYARAELVLRRDSHDLSVVAAYARGIALVLRRPMTLVHAGLGWLLAGAISIGYWAASHGHPMAGSDGAATLLIVRQGVVLARMAVHFAVLGGQVALTRQRALPLPAPTEARRRGPADA
jgi:hypothetical protein